MKLSKHYYEKSGILDSKVNITYHELFTKSDSELAEWIEEVRQFIIEDWDERGIPPMVGQSIEQIISSFKKLREYDIHGFIEKADDGQRNVIKNFNKFANGVNQFFPTMLKTRITNGATADDKDLSIYEHFSQDDKLENFVKVMNRAVKRDSMYAWCRSLTNKREENAFWNGQNPVQFIKDAHAGKVFTGKWEEYDILLHKTKHDNLKRYGTPDEDERTYGNIFYLESQETVSYTHLTLPTTPYV